MTAERCLQTRGAVTPTFTARAPALTTDSSTTSTTWRLPLRLHRALRCLTGDVTQRYTCYSLFSSKYGCSFFFFIYFFFLLNYASALTHLWLYFFLMRIVTPSQACAVLNTQAETVRCCTELSASRWELW